MTEWEVTYQYLRTGMPRRIEGDMNAACEALQQIANRRRLGREFGRELEFDGFTDQVDAYFRDSKGRRIRFAILMAG